MTKTFTDFKAWFGDMPLATPKHWKPLGSKKLPRGMNDQAILAELKPEPVTLSEVYETLKALDKSTWALFYVKDSTETLRVVFVLWDAGCGWDVNAYEVTYPSAWFAGLRVFSRNFGTETVGNSESQTLGNSDTSPLLTTK